MEKSSKNASPVSNAASHKEQKNLSALPSRDSFDINQIQSATSVRLSKDLCPSPQPGDLPGLTIQKLFEFNSKLYQKENNTSLFKKDSKEPSPKSSFHKLAKKFQSKVVPEPSGSYSNVDLKLPLPQKGDDEEPDAGAPASVTPSSTAKSLFSFIARKIKPNLFSVLRPPETEDDILFEDLGFELDNILIEFPYGIISPYGYFKKTWELLMTVVLFYVCTILPVRLCFSKIPGMFSPDRATDYEDDWIVFDIIIDSLIIADVIINFFSAYENVAGLLVSKRKDIAIAYIKGRFFVDLLSAFPINRNIFYIAHIEFEDRSFSFSTYRIWRIARFIKLIRILKLYDTIEHLFSVMTLNVDKIKIIKFLAFILLFIHITACLWNNVAELELEQNWQDLEDHTNLSLVERYANAVYFALTVLLTIGYGNLHPVGLIEKFVSIIWMFFGIIVYTYIFSALTISFAKLNQMKSAEEEKDIFYRQWTQSFKLPYETLDVILSTIGGDNSSQSAQKMEAITLALKVLEDLPKGLYIDIYNYIFKELIEKIEFFRHRPRHFVIKLIPLLKQTHFEKGDFIYSSGDPAMEVFFIMKGRVLSKCQDKYGKERIQVYVEGSFFGEGDIILKRNRTATLRAEDKSELWKINKKEFSELLEEFPAIKEEVEKLGKIKELYRTPLDIDLKAAKEREQMINKEILTGDHLYGGPKIFHALTKKMIKKIKKGRYFNPSLNFEPDLPSPDELQGQDSPDNSLDNNEKGIINKRELLKEEKKASSLIDLEKSKEYNSFQSKFSQKRRSLNEERNLMKEKSMSMKKSQNPKKRSLVQWEINFQAKKKLLEELKSKGIDINDTSEIDRVIQKDENLQKTKENAQTKCEQVEEAGEQMIQKVESMLAALDQYEDSLDQMIELYSNKEIR